MTALVVLEGFVILILGVLVVGLLRSHAEILRELHRLGVTEEESHDHGETLRVRDGIASPRPGSVEAVDITGARPDGGAGKVTMAGPQSTLLAFLSSGCTVCTGFWDAFSGRVELPDESTRLLIITKGPEEESESAIARLAPEHHQLLMSSEAWRDYEVPVSPYFVMVAGDGKVVGEGAAANWAQLANLMNEATADRNSRGHRARNARIDRELKNAGLDGDDPSLWASRQDGAG